MANLASVLGRIPGYGGFAARREQHEAEDAADARMELQARQLQSQVADRAAGRQFQEKQLQEQMAAREATRQLGLAQLEYQKEQGLREINFRYDQLGASETDKARKAVIEASRDAEIKRHNLKIEAIQGMLARVKAIGAERPKPKQDFRYKEGSDEQEVIPGSATDLKQKGLKAEAGKNVDLAVQAIDALDQALDALDKDPGLSRITGSLMGRTPNVTNEATTAQAKLDSIKSQTFVAALQAMRQASKTGGAVGNVTEKEGDKLENSLAALGQAQGTEDFKAQLKIMRDRLKASRVAMQRAYKEQYGEDAPSTPTLPPAPPTAVPSVPGAYSDPEKEKRYQEWKARQGK